MCSFSKEVITGQGRDRKVGPLEAGTYSITELESAGYEIDNAGPQQAPQVGRGRPHEVLAGAVIKNDGGDKRLWAPTPPEPGPRPDRLLLDTMPIGGHVATEVTPTGYTTSSDLGLVGISLG